MNDSIPFIDDIMNVFLTKLARATIVSIVPALGITLSSLAT